MILNKVSISHHFTPPQKSRLSPQNSAPLIQPPLFSTQTNQQDQLHFDDSHFSSLFRIQNKSKPSFAQPTTTFIRKVSHVQMRNSKKQNAKEAESDPSTIRQKIVNFFNYPIQSALFEPQASLIEGRQHRNYTSCSTRRKSTSVCSIYQSRKKISPSPEMQAASKRGKYQTLNPWTNREYLHKRKELEERHNRFNNSIDYSIIKPNDIQAAPIWSRHKHKTKDFDRTICPDLVETIRKRQDLLEKHRQMQLERQQIRKKRSQQSNRININTSYLNRRASSRAQRVQQRNEVLPWEVDTNVVDII